MKKMLKWVFGIVIALYLIGAIFGGDESNSSENNKNKKSKEVLTKKSEEVLIKKYKDLPIKKDLSYFLTPQNIAGQKILRINNSPLSNYEKGLELGGKRHIRKEKLYKLFNIDKYGHNKYGYRINAVATVEINSTSFSEFEIDDFEQKLKKEFAKSIQPIPDNYKKVVKHIRIVNLNIPVKYSKKSKKVASIKITDTASLKKINFSKEILLSDFVKELLNNKYISQYIIPSKDEYDKYKFEAMVNYSNKNIYSKGLNIKGDSQLLNNIGKVNKGNDIITELTLHVWNVGKGFGNKSYVTKFGITSFKLKSSNKRFTLSQYINLVNKQSIGNNYYIENDDVDMYFK